MSPAVEVRRVAPVPLLAVRRRASQAELSRVVPALCGVVWEMIRRTGVANPGRNVAVYLNGAIDCEVGVEVGADAAGEGDVVRTATPGGLIATTAHVGPYHLLGGAHEAIAAWCRANARTTAGPSWEVYGHWSDDPSRLRTDVCYLLREDA